MYYFIYLFVLTVSFYCVNHLIPIFWNSNKKRAQDCSIRKVATIPCSNEEGFIDGTWCKADTTCILLRGKGYADNKRKVKCDKSGLFEPIDLSIYAEGAGEKKISNVAENIPDIGRLIESNPDYLYLVVTWILPAEPHLSTVMIFRRRLDDSNTNKDCLLTRFIEGNNSFRKERFKFIPYIQRCPAIIRKGITLLGGERPTLLCKKISCKFFRGKNYLELDVNISSSSAARGLSGMMLPTMKKVSIIFAFTLEGRCDKELPEELLGAISVTNVDVAQIAKDYVVKYT